MITAGNKQGCGMPVDLRNAVVEGGLRSRTSPFVGNQPLVLACEDGAAWAVLAWWRAGVVGAAPSLCTRCESALEEV